MSCTLYQYEREPFNVWKYTVITKSPQECDIIVAPYLYDRIPTAAGFSACSGLALLYFCDWKEVLQYVPFWNTKYSLEPPRWFLNMKHSVFMQVANHHDHFVYTFTWWYSRTEQLVILSQRCHLFYKIVGDWVILMIIFITNLLLSLRVKELWKSFST